MADPLVVEVETACAVALGTAPSDDAGRRAAQQRVVALGESTDNMTTIQKVLDNSESDPAITACANALQRLCTDHWNVMSDAMRVEMRNYVLNLLANKGPKLQPFSVAALVKLLCRITKFAWFDPPTVPREDGGSVMRDIVKDAERFLTATVQHCIIGLKVLNELVMEMNMKNTTRTLTQHRKVAISFRDTSLLEVFELTLTMLSKCVTCAIPSASLPDAERKRADEVILELSLGLLIKCLGFDFLGTSPDESVEEMSVLQVPTSWRDRIQSGGTLRLLFNLYKGCTTGKVPLIPDAPPPDHAVAASTVIAMQQPTQPFRASSDRAAQTLEALCMYISIRKSVFAEDADRRRFLWHTMAGVIDVLRDQAGMENPDCYHQMCRLLARMKNNFQLTELASCKGYNDWLQRVADFTVQACTRLAWTTNSVHYVLSLWAKLVAAVPYARLESSSAAGGGAGGMPGSGPELGLDVHVSNVVGAYVRGRIDALSGPDMKESLEDLADLDRVEEQLEHVAALIRYQYDANTAVLVSMLDPLMAEYEKALAFIEANHMNILTGAASEHVVTRVRLIECQLAWMVAIVGPVVGQTAAQGGGSILTGMAASGDEQYDAELSSRVLKLMAMLDRRLTVASSSASRMPDPRMVKAMHELFKPDLRMELAILLFIDNFKKSYISESSGMPPPVPPPPGATAAGATSALLLSATRAKAAVGQGADAGMAGATGTGGSAASAKEMYDPTDYAALATSATGRQRSFIAMFNRMGLGHHVLVIGVILGKLANNLRHWNTSDAVIRSTLSVFHDLVFGYTSGKLLLSMEAVSGLLSTHGPEHFPFLAVPANVRHRTKFYTCLARLVFLEDDSERLEPFMAPIIANLERLAPAVGTRSDQVMRALIGAARDLRGILVAAQSRSAYVSIFEILHPRHLDMFIRALGAWADTPAVTTPILKMFTELCMQRGGRIQFGTNSPNGILLFRSASQAMTTYGARILAFRPPAGTNAYELKYKGVTATIATLNRCLDGGFVNFGVFALYGDRAVEVVLDMAFQLVASVPPDELLAIPKLAQAVMLFLQLVCRSHLDTLCNMPPSQFGHFIELLRRGLDHVDAETSLQAATAWDHVASTFVRNARKESSTAAPLKQQVAAQPGLFENLMRMLFQIVVFNESNAQWSVMRALLPAILASEMTHPQMLEQLKRELVESQPGSLQARMAEEFNKLCGDVTRSLEMANRDRFAQRLSIFRTTVREFAAV